MLILGQVRLEYLQWLDLGKNISHFLRILPGSAPDPVANLIIILTKKTIDNNKS